jgi:hypothetical protein
METFWWFVTIALMLTGLVGTVLPLVPGAILILVAAVVNHFTLESVGWGTLLVLTVLAIIGQAIDLVSGAAGAKWFGATRWGAIGGIAGAVVGLFFGLPGLLIGPLVGAVAGELLGGKGVLPAGKAVWGSFLGATAGLVAKAVVGLVMVGWFAVAAVL